MAVTDWRHCGTNRARQFQILTWVHRCLDLCKGIVRNGITFVKSATQATDCLQPSFRLLRPEPEIASVRGDQERAGLQLDSVISLSFQALLSFHCGPYAGVVDHGIH